MVGVRILFRAPLFCQVGKILTDTAKNRPPKPLQFRRFVSLCIPSVVQRGKAANSANFWRLPRFCPSGRFFLLCFLGGVALFVFAAFFRVSALWALFRRNNCVQIFFRSDWCGLCRRRNWRVPFLPIELLPRFFCGGVFFFSPLNVPRRTFRGCRSIICAQMQTPKRV